MTMREKKLIGWKKLQDSLVAKLEIPTSSKRILCIGPERKCRAERAKVLEIHITCPCARQYNTEHGYDNTTNVGVSAFSETKIIYEVGKVVEANGFNPDPAVECGFGINFFLSREEAEAYPRPR